MVDDTQGASPRNEQAHPESSEDAETRAARRELKQSTISDPPTDKTTYETNDEIVTAAADETTGKMTHSAPETAPQPDPEPTLEPAPAAKAEGRAETPCGEISDTTNAILKDRVASPKKKRAHDQLDGDKEDPDNDDASVASTDSAKDRASRLEPEKKRHRDGETGEPPLNPSPPGVQTGAQKAETDDENPSKKSPEASASAFAASGFGKLATGTSAFAALGAAQGGTLGAASKRTFSSFASTNSTAAASQPLRNTAAPKLTFGANGGSSPFAGLSTSSSNGFGSGHGGAFGSALSGAKPLFGFGASTGKPLQSGKAPKPFGAPDSDSDSGADEEEGDEAEDDGQADEAQRAASPEKDAEDRKRMKLHKVEVDDGEAGEATVVSVRAKMFSLDKEAGWKERGAGMLKINVPRSCVDFDENGAPVSGSFDASGLEADEEADGDSKGHRVVRLLMRQDQTHRVILNTAVVPAMSFQEKASLKSVGILFTAFEGPEAKPVSVTMKMSAANARAFINEIGMVQKELRGV